LELECDVEGVDVVDYLRFSMAARPNNTELERNRVKVLQAWRQTLHVIVENLLTQLGLEAAKQQVYF
jgi:hypothetical protein